MFSLEILQWMKLHGNSDPYSHRASSFHMYSDALSLNSILIQENQINGVKVEGKNNT